MPLVASAGPVSWAHQNGSLQSNGSITVKSLVGGSYSGTTNPTGAVAKANQSAVTQPPTVIIQATSSGYSETVPLVVTGTASIPSCPAGYTSLFSRSGVGYGVSNPVFNVSGSRFTFGVFSNGGSYYIGFGVDSSPMNRSGGGSGSLYSDTSQWVSPGQSWAVNLCSK